MSTETEPDYFRVMEQDSYKGRPKHNCVLWFLICGVILSVLLSVISLSVVLTQYKVEIHVAGNDGHLQKGPQTQALTLEEKIQTNGIKHAKLEPSGDKKNCSTRGGRFATQYLLTVQVGHITGAMTDHPIYATLIGQYGSCGQFYLETPIDNFQLGAKDEFLLTCDTAIGELKQVEMVNKGTDGLYMEGITVINLVNNREYDLPCECWIDDSEGGGLSSRNLTVSRHCTPVGL